LHAKLVFTNLIEKKDIEAVLSRLSEIFGCIAINDRM
jgi:hypothetical protein